MKSPRMTRTAHQYIERHTHRVLTEKLYGDGIVDFLYSDLRENPSWLFRALTGPRVSSLIGFISYDTILGQRITGNLSFLRACGV